MTNIRSRPCAANNSNSKPSLTTNTLLNPSKPRYGGSWQSFTPGRKKSPSRIMDEAQKEGKAVREAIRHFHVNLEEALDPRGNPPPLLRPIPAHPQKHPP